MRLDPGTNYTLAEEIAGKSHDAGAVNGAGVNHTTGASVSFFLTAGTFGASATLDAKVQYSNDNSNWTDDDGTTGNDSAITQLTAAGTAQLNVPAPRGRYSRVVATVAVAAVEFAVVSVMGPNRSVTV